MNFVMCKSCINAHLCHSELYAVMAKHGFILVLGWVLQPLLTFILLTLLLKSQRKERKLLQELEKILLVLLSTEPRRITRLFQLKLLPHHLQLLQLVQVPALPLLLFQQVLPHHLLQIHQAQVQHQASLQIQQVQSDHQMLQLILLLWL